MSEEGGVEEGHGLGPLEGMLGELIGKFSMWWESEALDTA